MPICTAGAPRLRASFFALTAALGLVGCGGDGSNTPTPSPAPPPSNSAPQFTSGASVSLAENSTGAFYTASASDADGDSLTFSISGGADATHFALGGAELSFVDGPNFDLFGDDNADNTYEVQLQVTDGRGGTATQNLRIAVTNSTEGIRVTRLGTPFNDPVSVSAYIGNQRIMVAERAGLVWSVNVNDGSRTLLRDLNLAPGRELLDVAGIGSNSTPQEPAALVRDGTGIYLLALGGTPAVEVKVADGPPMGATATLAYTKSSELGGSDQVVIAVGDPGGNRVQGGSGYGKIFILRAPGPSMTTSDLVLIGSGVQQPTRIFDFIGGPLIADAGQTVEHELSQLVSRTPVNLGWPFFEGDTRVRGGGPNDPVAPSVTYNFGSERFEGVKITGGLYYEEFAFERSRIDSLRDRVLFADANGSIFTIGLDFDPSTFEDRTQDFIPVSGEIGRIVAMAEDFDRVLLILDEDGELFRVDPD
mgnify:FL=1